MIVYTYYEDLGNEAVEGPLLEEWFARWMEAGFKPVVLGKGAAEVFSSYELARIRLSRLPTVNDPRYELACYNRYMALGSRGTTGGLLMDYDVFPVKDNVKEKIEYAIEKHVTNPLQPLFMGNYAKQCVSFFPSRNALQVLLSQFLDYEPKEDDLYEGKPHVSDMTIVNGSDVAYYQLTGDPGEDFCMAHISNPYATKTAQTKLSILNGLYEDKAAQGDSPEPSA